MSSSAPALGPIRRQNGVAGQVSYTVSATYPGERYPSTVTFVGNSRGGPVVMVTSHDRQVFVTEPSRFGKFGPEWVRQFFAN